MAAPLPSAQGDRRKMGALSRHHLGQNQADGRAQGLHDLMAGCLTSWPKLYGLYKLYNHGLIIV